MIYGDIVRGGGSRFGRVPVDEDLDATRRDQREYAGVPVVRDVHGAVDVRGQPDGHVK